jgi:type I site-specific restriction endonuclease
LPGLNEADTCRIYITPALKAAGWCDPHWRIAEQHYFTDGQIYLVGDGHRRRKGKKADYLLRYTESFPIATVEAKAVNNAQTLQGFNTFENWGYQNGWTVYVLNRFLIAICWLHERGIIS